MCIPLRSLLRTLESKAEPSLAVQRRRYGRQGLTRAKASAAPRRVALGVYGFGFWGLGFRVKGFGFGVWSLEFRV